MTEKKFPFEKLPHIEAYKPGIDFSLCRENLKRTVEERVRYLMELQRLAEEARKSKKKMKNSGVDNN